jgi:hypothetical protein
MGQNVTQFGWPKMQWTECSLMIFHPKKVFMFKTKCSGVDEHSVHLGIKCYSGRSEHLEIVLCRRFEGVKTLQGCSEHGLFVKAREGRGWKHRMVG